MRLNLHKHCRIADRHLKSSRRYILDPNAHHADSCACLVKCGVLIAAAEEERSCRIKHWAVFPSESIRYCLSEADIRLSDIDLVALNQDAAWLETREAPQSRYHRQRKRNFRGSWCMRQIIRDGLVLATHIPAHAAWRRGLNFFSAGDDFVQVGTWGYDAGKVLARHAHNIVTRSVTRTQEVLFVRRGRLRADIYDAAGALVEQVVAGPGDLLVLLNGGHGYEVLEDGTEVLEIKNGPYPGADADRTRF